MEVKRKIFKFKFDSEFYIWRVMKFPGISQQQWIYSITRYLFALSIPNPKDCWITRWAWGYFQIVSWTCKSAVYFIDTQRKILFYILKSKTDQNWIKYTRWGGFCEHWWDIENVDDFKIQANILKLCSFKHFWKFYPRSIRKCKFLLPFWKNVLTWPISLKLNQADTLLHLDKKILLARRIDEIENTRKKKFMLTIAD